MDYSWLVIVIILIVIELSTVNLTTIWFIVSGIISLFLSTFIDNYFILFGVFVIGGTLLLITTRPILLKYLKPKKVVTNIDRIIGMNGIVTEKITKNGGAVKVDGKIWSAYSKNEIDINETIKVLEINSTKLKVEKEG